MRRNNMIRVMWKKRLILATMCIVGLVVFVRQPARAENGDLPESVVLFEYTQPFETSWALNQPALVANPDGRLHLFWGVTPPQDTAIYYMELTDGVWSEPVDILLGPNMQNPNAGISAVLDSRGYLHVIWYNGGLYYSYAPAEEAGNPRAWAVPVEVVSSVHDGRLFVDGNDRLHAIYVDSQDVTALSYMHCESAACNWTAPSTVATAGQGEAMRLPHLWVSPKGVIHAVWGQVQLPDGWPPTGVFYARSVDEGETWSSPIQLGGEGQGNPAIIGLGEEELHLVWLATQPERYHTRSLDAGGTWTPPEEFTPVYGGMLVGYVGLLIDSARQIHLFVEGSNIPMHSVWDGRQWSSFESIGRGESAMAAITQGNLLHFVWLNPATVYYTSRTIPNAPAIAATRIPVEEEPIISEPGAPSETLSLPQVGLEPTPILEAELNLTPRLSSQTSSLAMPLLWSTGAVGLLTVIVLWVYWSQRKGFRR